METRKHFLNKTTAFSVREIAVLSIVTALCTVGRIMFQFIPNVQPMTTIFIIITLAVGLREGLVVSLLSLILSNIILGMGPWLFHQMISYTVVLLVAKLLLTRIYKRENANWILLSYAFVSGIIYGFVISYLSYKMFGMSRFLPYYLMGLSFDIIHGIGNTAFYFILNPLLGRLLKNGLRK